MHWYLVGGGPSLKGFDWSLLYNKQVIAINRAFEVCPKAQIIYFSDLRFWNWYSSKLLKHPAKKITGSRLEHSEVIHYKITGSRGLDLMQNCLRSGNSSGYAAINLAVHLGATRITLLGYDMAMGMQQETHWHNGYNIAFSPRCFGKMLGFFDYLKMPLERLSIEIVNANPASKIEVFPKISLYDAFK